MFATPSGGDVLATDAAATDAIGIDGHLMNRRRAVIALSVAVGARNDGVRSDDVGIFERKRGSGVVRISRGKRAIGFDEIGNESETESKSE